jgi:predicted AlkP superfamily pyrophosphatase or phosphodiesterase
MKFQTIYDDDVASGPPKALEVYRLLQTFVLAVLMLLAGCRPPLGSEPAVPGDPTAVPAGTPRLILFLVVDQGSYPQLERFRPLFTGGLARLLDEGISFTDMHHDHAITSTAPGHATLVTGAFPSRHGVVANDWFDREAGEWIEAVEHSGGEGSPGNLRASSLGDWLQEAYPRAKVFTASGKDRGAIFTGGRNADAAFWFDRETGHWTSSSYYLDAAPSWLAAFNTRQSLHRWFGTAWEPLPETEATVGTLGVEAVDFRPIEEGFPHPFGRPSLVPGESFYHGVYGSPFADAYLAEFALELLDAEELGGDPVPDLLGLSFSAMDAVGHGYGPDSPEALDTVLRLDRTLGELLDAIDQRVGLEHTLISLSSDHGVMPMPELLRQRGDEEAGRIGVAESLCVQQAGSALEENLGPGPWARSGFYLNRRALDSAGVDRREVENWLRRRLEQCPSVERVWTASELMDALEEGALEARAEPGSEAHFLRLYAHSFDRERSPDLLVQLRPRILASSAIANHTGPYPYDTHVPWLLRIPGARHGEITRPARTIDVAPTLAGLLGLSVPVSAQGEDLGELLQKAVSSR